MVMCQCPELGFGFGKVQKDFSISKNLNRISIYSAFTQCFIRLAPFCRLIAGIFIRPVRHLKPLITVSGTGIIWSANRLIEYVVSVLDFCRKDKVFINGLIST